MCTSDCRSEPGEFDPRRSRYAIKVLAAARELPKLEGRVRLPLIALAAARRMDGPYAGPARSSLPCSGPRWRGTSKVLELSANQSGVHTPVGSIPTLSVDLEACRNGSGHAWKACWGNTHGSSILSASAMRT